MKEAINVIGVTLKVILQQSLVNKHFVKMVLEVLKQFLIVGAQHAGWSLLLKAVSGRYLRLFA